LVFGHDASNPDEFFGTYLEVTPHSRLVLDELLVMNF